MNSPNYAIAVASWLDVLEVLKVQHGALDYAYLRKWAEELGLSALLERAIQESTFEA